MQWTVNVSFRSPKPAIFNWKISLYHWLIHLSWLEFKVSSSRYKEAQKRVFVKGSRPWLDVNFNMFQHFQILHKFFTHKVMHWYLIENIFFGSFYRTIWIAIRPIIIYMALIISRNCKKIANGLLWVTYRSG